MAQAVFYIGLAAMAGGQIVSANAAAEESRERARILEQELRTSELAAMQDENNRLSALNFANQDIIANAGGIDAYASPTLTALRQFNFRVHNEAVEDLRLNLATARASTSASVRILRNNARTAMTAGILSAAGTLMSGAAKGSMLRSPSQPPPAGVPA